MQIKIRWLKVLRNNTIVKPYQEFVQRMANRLCMGQIRYGDPHEDKRYLTRLKKELKVYEKTGNVEQLYNIANYCILESIAPENPKFHFNPFVNSVTR